MKITTLTNPRQTVLVACRYRDKDNIITLDWHTPLSFYPMMYAISVGKTRYSLGLIRNSGCFVVNFMSRDFEKEILLQLHQVEYPESPYSGMRRSPDVSRDRDAA